MALERQRVNRPALIFFILLALGAVVGALYFVGSNVAHQHDMDQEKAEGRPSVTPNKGAP